MRPQHSGWSFVSVYGRCRGDVPAGESDPDHLRQEDGFTPIDAIDGCGYGRLMRLRAVKVILSHQHDG